MFVWQVSLHRFIFKPSRTTCLTTLHYTNYLTSLPCYNNEKKCNMVYHGISVSLFFCHQPSVLLRRQNIAPWLKPRCNILSPQQNFRLMTKITLQKFHNIPYTSIFWMILLCDILRFLFILILLLEGDLSCILEHPRFEKIFDKVKFLLYIHWCGLGKSGDDAIFVLWC